MWEIFIVLSVSFLATNSFIIKNIKNADPKVIIFWQFLISIILVYIYSILFGKELIFNPFLIILGLGYVISLTLYYSSLKVSDLSKVAPVFNLSVVVSAILGIIFLSEEINLKIIGGIILGATGIYLLGGKK